MTVATLKTREKGRLAVGWKETGYSLWIFVVAVLVVVVVPGWIVNLFLSPHTSSSSPISFSQQVQNSIHKDLHIHTVMTQFPTRPIYFLPLDPTSILSFKTPNTLALKSTTITSVHYCWLHSQAKRTRNVALVLHGIFG